MLEVETQYAEIHMYKGVCSYQKYLLKILDTEILPVQELAVTETNLWLHRGLQRLGKIIEVWWLLLNLETHYYYY